jgi:DNA-binding NarL/FixJ family response regulator
MIKILLADNRIVVLHGLRALLEARQGFQICAEARDGHRAIELAAHLKPDIAILDLSLPIFDGIEATRRIRNQSPQTEVMIFALPTGECRVRDALGAGARGYILKSESDDQIVKAVEELARHRAFYSSHLLDSLLAQSEGYKMNTGHSNALSTREKEVMCLVAEGKSNKVIAHSLDISIKTVEAHRSALMRKLNVNSTAQLVRYAIRCKLIVP